jgi:hypothetical protein
MSPILLGLVVTCCSARQRPVSRADPRSPRQRSDPLEGVAGAGIDIEVLAAGRLAHRDVDADPGSVVSRVGQGRQARCGGGVQRGERVGAGGGDVVH